MMMPVSDMDKEMKKRREAMRQRLEKLGKGNPVVAEAVKSNMPHKDMDEWEMVDELVMAARKRFHEDGDLKKCAMNLADALMKMAKGGGLDKGKENHDNIENSGKEEY